jgi:uncharacterized protein
MLKYYSIMILCCFVVAFNASAEVPSDAQLDELFRVTKVESLLAETRNQLEGNIKAGVQQSMSQAQIPPALVPEVNKLLDTTVPKSVQRAQEQLSWANMKPKYIQLYRESFTQQEVVDMISFYNTPSGQSVINKMPALMQKIMGMTQQMMIPLMMQMNADLRTAMGALEESSKGK